MTYLFDYMFNHPVIFAVDITFLIIIISLITGVFLLKTKVDNLYTNVNKLQYYILQKPSDSQGIK